MALVQNKIYLNGNGALLPPKRAGLSSSNKLFIVMQLQRKIVKGGENTESKFTWRSSVSACGFRDRNKDGSKDQNKQLSHGHMGRYSRLNELG